MFVILLLPAAFFRGTVLALAAALMCKIVGLLDDLVVGSEDMLVRFTLKCPVVGLRRFSMCSL